MTNFMNGEFMVAIESLEYDEMTLNAVPMVFMMTATMMMIYNA